MSLEVTLIILLANENRSLPWICGLTHDAPSKPGKPPAPLDLGDSSEERTGTLCCAQWAP